MDALDGRNVTAPTETPATYTTPATATPATPATSAAPATATPTTGRRGARRAFPEAFVDLVRAGERSGALADVLGCLLREALRLKRLSATVRGIVLYPVLSVWGALALLLAMEVLVLPRMIGIYTELGAEIPGLTQLMIDVSNLWVAHGGLFLLLVAALVVLQVRFLFRPDFGGAVWGLLSRVPPLSTYFRRMNSATFLGMAGGLLRYGVPLPDALGLAGSTLIGEEARRDARHAQEMALAGATPEQASWFYLFVPDEARELLHSAQPGQPSTESGEGGAAQPAQAMEDLADYYERRLDKANWGALALLEPIPIILVALLLGMMVMALYLPLFNIGRAIR
jgi:type IV pilus assembly protein PilC